MECWQTQFHPHSPAPDQLHCKNDGYKTYGEDMADRETILKDTINSVINTYTMDEFNADRQAVKDAILAELQKQFGSDFIIAVNFSEVTVV